MTATPNMGLDLPVPGVTPGLDWATMLAAALLVVDLHDHTDGKGALVPNTAVDSVDDWEFNQFGINNTNWIAFTGENTVDLTRLQQLYANPAGELCWINAAGQVLRLTNGGQLDLTANRGINGNYATDPASPSVTYATGSKTYRFFHTGHDLAMVQLGGLSVGLLLLAVSTNYTVLDDDGVAVIAISTDTGTGSTVTLPLAANNAGRMLTIKDRTGTANLHNFTVQRSGADTIDGSTSIVYNGANAVLRVVSDGVSRWMVV